MKTCRCFGRMVSNPSPVPRRLPQPECPYFGGGVRALGTRLAFLLLGTLALACGASGADEADSGPPDGGPRNSVMPGVDEMADALVELTARRWEGPVVPWPAESERPPATLTLRSELRPLAVHGDGSPERLRAVLEALETTADYADAGSFPRPFRDGSLGGGPAFDVYVAPIERLVTARADRPLVWSFLDGVTVHGIIDPGVPAEDLAPCIAQLYGEAVALAQDPAEAPAWHRAFGSFLAWHQTGRFGCADAIDQQQSAAGLPWIGRGERTSADHGAGGGLLLAMLSQRHDGGDGAFVRELFQFARQRSWGNGDLRAAPDLWQALHRSVELAGDRFHSMMEDFAVARGFLGERDRHGPLQNLRGLGPGASAPIVFELSLDDLPHHTPNGPELQTFGSAYALVDVRGAPAQSRLRVWLRGEYGVEWALTASRLDAGGRELARLSAPPRRADRRSYLPVELTPDTAQVLIGVTNLSHRLPDDDLPDEMGRAFRLIFELVSEDEPER